MAQSAGQTPTWRQYAAAFRTLAASKKRSAESTEAQLAYAKRLFKRGLPIVFDQEHLSRLVGVRLDYLQSCSSDARKYYREFEIAKRSGKSRTIAAPLPTLMRVQRWILQNVLDRCPSTPFAKAYIRGRSVKDNARFHLRQSVVVLADIKDFFPSISTHRVYRVFRAMGYTKAVSALFAGLVTLKGHLPQGAPTSPALSNLVCRRIDWRLAGYCIPRGWRYTRYADDLAVSGDDSVRQVIRMIVSVIRDEGFVLHEAKTRVLRSHQQQLVTGLVVNEFLQTPRSMRRALRQAKYFIGKFGMSAHMQYKSIVKTNYRAHLIGLALHVLFVNPRDRDAAALLEILRS